MLLTVSGVLLLDTSIPIGRMQRNGEGGASVSASEVEGGASTSASEVALYDANTLMRLEHIALYNAASQAVLGGDSPRDMAFGSRAVSFNLQRREQLVASTKNSRSPSTVQIEELQGSSSCEDPPPKRFRLDGQPGRDSPPRESNSPVTSSDSSPEGPGGVNSCFSQGAVCSPCEV
jgi:hypothetical protein